MASESEDYYQKIKELIKENKCSYIDIIRECPNRIDLVKECFDNYQTPNKKGAIYAIRARNKDLIDLCIPCICIPITHMTITYSKVIPNNDDICFGCGSCPCSIVDKDTVVEAIVCDCVSFIASIIERNRLYLFDNDSLELAIKNDSIDVFKLIFNIVNRTYNTTHYAILCVRYSSTSILKYMIKESYITLNYSLLHYAIVYGAYSSVKTLIKYKCEMGPGLLASAINRKYFDIAKLLWNADCPINDASVIKAMRKYPEFEKEYIVL